MKKSTSSTNSTSAIFVFAAAASFTLLSGSLISLQSASAQQTSHRNENTQLVAINIPNFSPSARYSNGILEVAIPQALLAAGIDQVLRANEGRIKDTEFQKVDVRNMRFSLVQERFDACGNRPNCIGSGSGRLESGFRVDGDWQFQFREKIGCAFGKCHYTPWVSVSGSFSQPLYFRINASRLDLQPGGITIRGERWYADAVGPIAGIFDVHGSVKENLRGAIQDINGMDLRQVLIDYGSREAANQVGIDQQVVSQLISQNAGNIGAQVASGNLVVSISLPQVGERFDKPGNNGTVSCAIFCGAVRANGQPVWGDKVGVNVGSSQPVGAAGVCSCAQSPNLFVKKGNNGTVTCDTFCRGSQWGQVGTCVASFDNKNGTGRDGNYLPGFLNGPELTCTCVK